MEIKGKAVKWHWEGNIRVVEEIEIEAVVIEESDLEGIDNPETKTNLVYPCYVAKGLEGSIVLDDGKILIPVSKPEIGIQVPDSQMDKFGGDALEPKKEDESK